VSDPAPSRHLQLLNGFAVHVIVLATSVAIARQVVDAASPLHAVLLAVELMLALIFAVEWVARLIFSPNRRQFLFSLDSLFHLAAVLPYALTFTAGFVVLRTFHLVQLGRQAPFEADGGELACKAVEPASSGVSGIAVFETRLAAYKRLLLPLGLAAFACAIMLMPSIDLPLAMHFRYQKTELSHWAETFTGVGSSTVYLIVCPAAMLIFYWLGLRYLHRAAGMLFVSIAVAGIGVNILKFFLGRGRPSAWFRDEDFGFFLFQVASRYTSFPSGHAAVCGAILMTLTLYFPRAWPLWLITYSSVGLTRIVVTAHYLSDVIVGLFFGITCTILLAHHIPVLRPTSQEPLTFRSLLVRHSDDKIV